MDILYMIGMTGFIVLVLVLLIGVWEDYRDEHKRHSNILSVHGKIVVLGGESSFGRRYHENKTDAELSLAALPVYVPSMKEFAEKRC
jgi:hypothetical protein